MGTLLTMVIGGAVVGYAAFVIWGVVRKTRAGECSGCSGCPSEGHCDSKR